MNEIAIVVNYSDEKPTVSGRELHKALQISTKYSDWFKRMCDYGFEEGRDYQTCFPNLRSENQHGGQNKADHQLTIDMAKELCMIQRTEIGKRCREYFLTIERSWNSPESVMARALQFANQHLELIMQQNSRLIETNKTQAKQIEEMLPKVSYCDVVLNCTDLMTVNAIAKDYGKSAIWMNKWLNEHKVQYKQGDVWLLYQKYAKKGYTSSKTSTFIGTDGVQHCRTHTYWTQAGRLFIYDLLKEHGILPLIEKSDDEA